VATNITVNSAGGADYTTIAAAVASLPSTWVDDYFILVYKGSGYAETITASGFTTGSYRLTIMPASGEGFDASDVQFYNSANGASNENGGTLVNFNFQGNVTVTGFLMKQTSGVFDQTVNLGFSCDTTHIVGNIFERDVFSVDPPITALTGLVAYNLGYNVSNEGNGNAFVKKHEARILNNCFVNLDGGTMPAIETTNDNGAVANNTFWGFSSGQVGSNPCMHYNMTELSSGFTGTGNIYSQTFSDQYVSTTADFTPKTGNDLLAGVDDYVADSGNLDIVGEAQPGSEPWYVGHMVFVSGGGSDVTLGLSGQAGTAAAGSFLLGHTNATTGTSCTSSAGSFLLSHAQSLVGSAVSQALGTLGMTHGQTVSGQAVTAAAGGLSLTLTLSPTGQIVSASLGTLTPSGGDGGDVNLALGGANVLASTGTLSYALTKALAGSSVSCLANGTNYTIDEVSSGQTVTSSAGTLGNIHTIGLVGSLVNATGGTITASGGDSSALVYSGHRMYVYVVSASGRTKWVDYIPIKYITISDVQKVNTYNDDGALAVTTIVDTTGKVEWTDYKPVVVSADPTSGQYTYNDLGYLRVTEVV
jgi:hypothetical protein